MMGSFTGFLGLRKRSKQGVKATDDPKQTEQVENPSEKAVADASTGYRRATALERRRGGTKTREATLLGFDLEDLFTAFSERLGKGTFGITDKAKLETGTPMVVKRLRDLSDEFREKQFREMVDAIDKMNHPNTFPLTAYYYSNDEKLLVYDYMPMGSLHARLHVNGSPLNWDTRINIALGTARAIAYIHSKSPPTFHGNIKSSNILLTTTLEACLSDYGLVEYGPPQFVGMAPAAILVQGYRAPEGIRTSKVFQKADVYSFGVLFLELLTRKDPIESLMENEGMDLPSWMLLVINEEWTSEVFDVELLRHVNGEVLLQYLELAFTWTAKDPDIRPSMAQVITQIEKLCQSSSPSMKHVMI